MGSSSNPQITFARSSFQALLLQLMAHLLWKYFVNRRYYVMLRSQMRIQKARADAGSGLQPSPPPSPPPLIPALPPCSSAAAAADADATAADAAADADAAARAALRARFAEEDRRVQGQMAQARA